MTTHVRQQIRDAAVGLLTGLTTTGSRVHASRIRPLEAGSLPCLLVTTDAEDIAPGTAQNLLERQLVLTVRGIARGTDTLDDTLDTIALEVETALAASPTLSGECTATALEAVRVVFDDDADRPIGEISLSYRCTYFTLAGTPGVLA